MYWYVMTQKYGASLVVIQFPDLLRVLLVVPVCSRADTLYDSCDAALETGGYLPASVFSSF